VDVPEREDTALHIAKFVAHEKRVVAAQPKRPLRQISQIEIAA
jgi:hypothetical protein